MRKGIIPDLDLKQKTLFGCRLDEVKKMFLTPEKEIYEIMAAKGVKRYQGWWKTAYLGRKAIVVRAWVGRAIQDAIFYAEKIDEIVLLGYCGACVSDINRWDLLCGKEATRGSESVVATILFSGLLNCKVYEVESVCEEESGGFLQRMADLKVKAVDMESYSAFAMAKNMGKRIGAIYLVTDNLVSQPFWRKPEDKCCRPTEVNKLIRFALGVMGNESY